MSNHKQALGKWGEEKASAYLSGKGFHILAHNIRTPYGEIDLIAQDGSTLVFIEVKTRTTKNFGNPEEAITKKKLQHMIDSAESYMQELEEKKDWRLDVVAVEKDKNSNSVSIEHFENVNG
ncbi:MAG: YraN family protein [Chloroflexi bacterium]|jgi:putative endonuclease|nr:YraN family protein [Chloroflexota bacterium]MBT3668703.1 YraN family protein [Chloroflexota bacterium]MBT4001783.1 YraN family protein [Chloroflexota bacterium]MBT4305404.1 YraN family protein [Chloroflexota bacterium]MBT4532550.1 YraN family protein [Chloroflexota bacterium]